MKLIAKTFVHGVPKAQPRARASSFGGGRARIYDPGTSNGWKNLIAVALKEHAGEGVTGPLKVVCEFFMPRPKGHYGTGRNADKLKPSAPVYHVSKPDTDNLEKAVYDALSHKSGIGLWHDDSQIVEAITRKAYTNTKSNFGMRIEIHELGEETAL